MKLHCPVCGEPGERDANIITDCGFDEIIYLPFIDQTMDNVLHMRYAVCKRDYLLIPPSTI